MMTQIEYLKLAVEKLIMLHKLISQNQGESIDADLIRDDLDSYHKNLSWEDKDWLSDMSDTLYGLVNHE